MLQQMLKIPVQGKSIFLRIISLYLLQACHDSV